MKILSQSHPFGGWGVPAPGPVASYALNKPQNGLNGSTVQLLTLACKGLETASAVRKGPSTAMVTLPPLMPYQRRQCKQTMNVASEIRYDTIR